MTEKSSGVRGANITDLHIAMVRDDFTIQTFVEDLKNTRYELCHCQKNTHSLSGVSMVKGSL